MKESTLPLDTLLPTRLAYSYSTIMNAYESTSCRAYYYEVSSLSSNEPLHSDGTAAACRAYQLQTKGAHCLWSANTTCLHYTSQHSRQHVVIRKCAYNARVLIRVMLEHTLRTSSGEARSWLRRRKRSSVSSDTQPPAPICERRYASRDRFALLK